MLFVNLTEEEYEEMGIVSKFHIRKLEIIMKAFQSRYENKKDALAAGKRVTEDDDELLSEYTPSELSDIIGHEDDDDFDVRTCMRVFVCLS